MKDLKPMLAAKDASKLRFPLLASVKLDGVRALVVDGVVLSRTLKPIPNARVQRLFGCPEFNGFDGELCVGPANAPDLMQKTMSGVMSKGGDPDVQYHVFDVWNQPNLRFHMRDPRNKWVMGPSGYVTFVEQTLIDDQEELDRYEAWALTEGYEGVMVRDPLGLYKFGRATAKGGELVKIKRFVDGEAVVVGVEERMHNDNEATVDNLGHTKRSTHQENKRPAGDLGALVCQQLFGGDQGGSYTVKKPCGPLFRIGTGFSAEQRKELWESPPVGKIAKFKHFDQVGVVDAPRFPVWLGWRHPEDM